MILKEISCLKCGASLSRSDIDTRLNVVKCSHCNSLFSLENYSSDSEVEKSKVHERQPVPMPAKLKLLYKGTSFVIQRKWFSAKYIFLLFFTVFWNAFMVGWHAISLSQGMMIMSVAGLLHTAVGVFIAYITIAGFLNKTDIIIKRGQLVVKHYPLPWPGSKNISTNEIEQLYCKENISRSKNGTTRTYEVKVILNNRTDQSLVKNMEDVQQALFIEQEIENKLGIENREVAGEYKL